MIPLGLLVIQDYQRNLGYKSSARVYCLKKHCMTCGTFHLRDRIHEMADDRETDSLQA